MNARSEHLAQLVIGNGIGYRERVKTARLQVYNGTNAVAQSRHARFWMDSVCAAVREHQHEFGSSATVFMTPDIMAAAAQVERYYAIHAREMDGHPISIARAREILDSQYARGAGAEIEITDEERARIVAEIDLIGDGRLSVRDFIVKHAGRGAIVRALYEKES